MHTDGVRRAGFRIRGQFDARGEASRREYRCLVGGNRTSCGRNVESDLNGFDG